LSLSKQTQLGEELISKKRKKSIVTPSSPQKGGGGFHQKIKRQKWHQLLKATKNEGHKHIRERATNKKVFS
jgi:hypothetical protein